MIKSTFAIGIIPFITLFINQIHCVQEGYSAGDKLISIVTQPFISKDIQVTEPKIEPAIGNIVYPKYGFQYVVTDPKTEDIKNQNGDLVKGQYTLVEANADTGTVKFTVDDRIGLNAEMSEIIRPGYHAVLPEVVKTYIIGVARGDNGDWEERKIYETTKAPNILLTD